MNKQETNFIKTVKTFTPTGVVEINFLFSLHPTIQPMFNFKYSGRKQTYYKRFLAFRERKLMVIFTAVLAISKVNNRTRNIQKSIQLNTHTIICVLQINV